MSKKTLVIIIVALCAILIGVGTYIFFSNRSDTDIEAGIEFYGTYVYEEIENDVVKDINIYSITLNRNHTFELTFNWHIEQQAEDGSWKIGTTLTGEPMKGYNWANGKIAENNGKIYYDGKIYLEVEAADFGTNSSIQKGKTFEVEILDNSLIMLIPGRAEKFEFTKK